MSCVAAQVGFAAAAGEQQWRSLDGRLASVYVSAYHVVMRRKPPAGRRNPRQKPGTDGTLDLFQQKMVAAMQASLEVGESAAGDAAAPVQPGLDAKEGGTVRAEMRALECDAPPVVEEKADTATEPERETLPTRMLNEFV